MRLHHLEVTAFGPFADTVTVDFDHLSDAGLFLLSGATGAGKTSVLDAVCFALYGDVPGDRNSAKRLRSDHAAPGVAPRVVLEATLSGRRFRLVRSPAWDRPKKRGTGTTTEQASVTLSERVEGDWQPLSSRLDETGHLVTSLVGMNVTQFTQVAMLPQGRFQAFLRARSEERHRLLQQLFRTGRFEEVERWLRDRRLALRRSAETAHQGVADLVSRVSETADVELPEDWDIRELDAPAGSGALRAWAGALLESASDRRLATEAAARAAGDAEARARNDLEAGRTLAARRERHDAAAAEHARLLARGDEHDAARAALDAGRRAATVAPLHRLEASAVAAHAHATLRANSSRAEAAELLGLLIVDDGTLAAAVAESADLAARVRATLPRESRLGVVATEIADADRRRTDVVRRIAAATAERQTLPARITGLRTELAETQVAAAGRGPVETRLSELGERLQAHERARRLDGELVAARAVLDASSRAATALRESWLDLREARLEGMAAEIAGALAVGACCPVCGSADHPNKASAGLGAPDAAAERAALKALDDAKATEHLHDEQVRDLTTRLAVARDQAGDRSVDQLAALRRDAEAELAALTSAAARAERLTATLAAAEADEARITEEQHALELEEGALATSLAALRDEAAQLRAEIDGLLRGTGADSLDALLEVLLGRVAVGRAAVEALVALATAEKSLADATETLATAASEAGFASPDDAAASLLAPASLDDLERRVADHDRRLAALAAVLAEPGAAELAGAPLPDLAALAAAHTAALAALGEARSGASRWAGRHERLRVLVADLLTALDAWAPLRRDLDLVSRLASFVDGKSADNRLQMRLSAYVLAFRLSQVVAAANERLAGMSDQRYSLEHTGQRGAGETRGGLSLQVRDDWSGESRDPATLSGGETFVVSLALALGLADVITQEAGGADLDTLFVDEGFGSLDADTLDDVMDTLDSLRDGGRVVGVVSHVAEMRDRIPTQLRISKSRRGSALALSR